jgi:hypothetical protein
MRLPERPSTPCQSSANAHARASYPWKRHSCRDNQTCHHASRPEAAPTNPNNPLWERHSCRDNQTCRHHRGQRPLPQTHTTPCGSGIPAATTKRASIIAARGRSHIPTHPPVGAAFLPRQPTCQHHRGQSPLPHTHTPPCGSGIPAATNKRASIIAARGRSHKPEQPPVGAASPPRRPYIRARSQALSPKP